MFKLITFDGMSGSGKSTNHQKLCDHLNIKRVYDNIFSVIRQAIDHHLFSGLDLRLVLWMAMVQLSWYLSWKHKDILVLSGYWQYIVDYFRFQKERDNRRDEIMDAIDKILFMDDKPAPLCSFYMNISSYKSKLRFLSREAYYGLAEDKLENLTVGGVEDTEIARQNDARLQEIVNWLSDRYEYFHIIDADRPLDEVFSDVKHIVDGGLQ